MSFTINDLIGFIVTTYFLNVTNIILYSMDTTTLNPTQMHLLKLFAFDRSEKRAHEIQNVLLQYFQNRLDTESDRLWDEGILDQEQLDIIRHEDLHLNNEACS